MPLIFRSAPKTPRSPILSEFPGSTVKSAAEADFIAAPSMIQLFILSIMNSAFILLSAIAFITSAGTVVSPLSEITALPPPCFMMSAAMSAQDF